MSKCRVKISLRTCLAASPNGRDKLYAVLTGGFIPFGKLPTPTLMTEAILGHEYPEGK